MDIAVSSRIRRSPNYNRRLTDDQVRNIFRRSSVYFIEDDGIIIDGHVCGWTMEVHGPRAGQLGAIVRKPDDRTTWLWGVDPATHEVLLIQRLVTARHETH